MCLMLRFNSLQQNALQRVFAKQQQLPQFVSCIPQSRPFARSAMITIWLELTRSKFDQIDQMRVRKLGAFARC